MDNIETTSMNSPKNFQCPVCEKHFSRKFTLDMHLLIHKGLKPHSCSICGRCFRQKGTLMRHKALHSTTALFQCHLCNKAYRQKNVYLHHLKYTHKVPTSGSLERKKFSSITANAENMALAYPQNYLPVNESNKSIQDVTLIDNVHLPISASKAITCLNETDIISSGRGNVVKKGIDRPKYDKLNSATDSYWRCDFCGIIMKYSYENCTRHVATHKKEFTFQCLSCSSVFLEKTELLNHHSRCVAYQSQLQIKVPYSLSLDEPSTCYAETEATNRNLSDVTFTCIPCQLDFQTEDDFECHVKTHVQSVLGDCSESSPDLPETKFIPYSIEQNLAYPGSSGMERAEKIGDPYECGNPYELINTVVAGANSVLNFMSNINNEDLNNSRPANGLDSSARMNLQKPELIIKKQVKSEKNHKISTGSREEIFNCDKQINIRSKSTIANKSPSLKSLSSLNKNGSKLISNENNKSTLTKNKNEYKETLSTKLKDKLDNGSELNLHSRDGSRECLKEISHIKYFSCNICKMKFKSRFQRQLHLTKHIQLISIKCTLCNKIFLHKFQLLQHLRQVHSKKFSCPNLFCQKRFTNKNLRELHKKTCKAELVPNLRNLAFAPVIDLTKISSENEDRILGVIPLNDKRNEIRIKKEINTQIRFGIPVLTLESMKKGCAGLPIIGEISLLK